MASVAASIQQAFGYQGVSVASKIAAGEVMGFGATVYTVLWPLALVAAAIAAVVVLFGSWLKLLMLLKLQVLMDKLNRLKRALKILKIDLKKLKMKQINYNKHLILTILSLIN